MTKIACVVQGDIRVDLGPIIEALLPCVDYIVLSTWKECLDSVPKHVGCKIIGNDKPLRNGFSNRNLQRITTAAGISHAEIGGCTHILKWRTDLLPTKLSRAMLLSWVEACATGSQHGRIVMSAFRNLSVEPDWFSSFPDLFAFGRLSDMKMLWSDEGIDYRREFNIPAQMVEDCAITLRESSSSIECNDLHGSILEYYNAHVELYAVFKDRLQRATGRLWTHPAIAFELLHLVDHRTIGICWIRSSSRSRFRAISQAGNLPWWTAGAWKRGDAPSIVALRDTVVQQSHRRTRLTSLVASGLEIALQYYWHAIRTSRDTR
jgi:hypothetical protein